jgi:hypothetical protein
LALLIDSPLTAKALSVWSMRAWLSKRKVCHC